MNILGYHVYTTRDGGMWLSEDEKTWTTRFNEAASFTSYELARDIGEREETNDGDTGRVDDTIYIFARL